MGSGKPNKPIDFQNTEVAFRSRTDGELLRGLGLFKTMSAPRLVRFGSSLLQLGFKVGLPLSPLVRWTIFKQFCGGESLEECRPLLTSLAASGVRAILDYGAEGESTEIGFQTATQELLRTAKEAGSNPNIPFVVFKFTGIARFELLERISQGGLANLSEQEESEWHRVVHRVDHICDEAIANGCPVMIDAEESWIQKAVDRESERQMRVRNRERVWVYTTVQLYRSDRLDYLKKTSATAKSEGWKLGAKLVRGAYMEKERDYAQSKGKLSPIHDSKAQTDRAYDEAVNYCLSRLDHIAVCIGTHNEESTALASARTLSLEPNIAQTSVWFSQLYGMSDHLTYNLAAAGLNATKYVPYGPVHAVVPYLIRRAQENTSVAGQSGREVQLLEKELNRRRTSI